jgi:hypothetical protein
LRLYPQFRLEERRSETFTSPIPLVERLLTLGVSEMDPGKSFPKLGGALDAMWSNVEIPRETFQSFGRAVRALADHALAAA